MPKPLMPSSFTDTVSLAPWLRFLPASLRRVMVLARFDRPVGIVLLLLPAWWGLALAGAGLRDWPLYAAFASGALAMRATGCIINDIADRRIDASVARTQSRPLASGALSLKTAFAALFVFAAVAVAVLATLNAFTVMLAVAVAPLIVLYPFIKRVSSCPQLALALTFNWGALMGWSAVHGALALPPLLLYAAAAAFTMAYDTVYACMDAEDDSRLALGSTALLFGSYVGAWVAAFHGAALLLLAAAATCAGLYGLGLWGGLAACALWLVGLNRRFCPLQGESCLFVFRAHQGALALVLLALLMGERA